MFGPMLRQCLAPALAICLVLTGSLAIAEEPESESAAPAGVTPAASFPVGRMEPIEIELVDCDPLFDDECEEQLDSDIYDPLERTNRAVYGFNQKVDRYVFKPVTGAYRFAVPGIARRSVRRLFLNLNAPIYMVNNLLQLRFFDALQTFGAFVMNLTFGIGGLIDTADGIGCELKPADFGQTLALAGVGSGPYMIIPVLGPTTTRDGLGWEHQRRAISLG